MATLLGLVLLPVTAPISVIIQVVQAVTPSPLDTDYARRMDS